MTLTENSGRTYAGVDAKTRRAVRRAQLLDASLDAFGTLGFAASSVKEILRRAQLTERYFYESFSNREDALAELYEELIAGAADEVVKSLSAHPNVGPERAIEVGLGAFYAYFAGDPCRARVVFHEAFGVSPAMDERIRGAKERFAHLIVASARAYSMLPADVDEDRVAVLSTALVGAITQLASSWATGHLRVPVHVLVDETVGLFMGALASITRVRPSAAR